jgi:hypothetical protein
VVKVERLKWLGYFFRTQELDTCRKLTVLNTVGTRRVGKRNLRWLESFEEDLKNVGVRDWRLKSENQEGQFWKRLKFFKDCKPGRKIKRKRKRTVSA